MYEEPILTECGDISELVLGTSHFGTDFDISMIAPEFEYEATVQQNNIGNDLKG